ncbi:portal protein [Mycobacterium phage ShedlockHolmes]|uniref:Portal protein n=3 Tax=Keshuvirus TaxID=2948781 RepID=G1D517_9CAUD|nr:portal protein [Mycobacterium phage ShedlockHolmes]YP_009637346.1 portal protein [Mycobacterium phage Pixie]AEK09820.1 portal protein [Mycobacterium phage Pixie]AKF15185.1 portal protein [Mycobacterium phage ShedlockHolmes]AOT23748.1 portal protein [Mycobacterium phage TBond007]
MLPQFIEPTAQGDGDHDDDDVEYEGRLTDAQIVKLVQEMWLLQLTERSQLDRIYEYTKGRRGRPKLPEGASDEVKDIAALSVKNVLRLVRDSFAQNLSVTGYRDLSAQENSAGWQDWQRNRMDARQAEVHRPAVQYGCAYVTVTPGPDGPEWRTRSPRQLLAVYDDPVLDAWPQFALETWVATKNAKPHRRAVLYDDLYMYELDLGEVPVIDKGDGESASKPISVREVEDVIPHHATFNGKPVCPVVRFINDRDADDMIVGEIEPLIGMQQAINYVNFDRLVVSRFGANPQRVITGWSGSKTEVLKASALRVWTFDDPEVKAQAFPAASLQPYNDVLNEMMQHVAMEAQINPSTITSISNVSADALAACEHNMQLKLANKRESFGESWEQVLRLSAAMGDDAETADDAAAEVIWRDTEARSFATVVDGIVKLATAGVPIEFLLPLVPGMTQQQISAIKQAMRGGGTQSLVEKLLSLPQPTEPDAPPLDEAQASADKSGGTQGDGGAAGSTAVSGGANPPQQ